MSIQNPEEDWERELMERMASERDKDPAEFSKKCRQVKEATKVQSVPPPDHDPVNQPDHYTSDTGVECIDYIRQTLSEEGYQGYLEGACKKYLHRWKHKDNPLEDLKKAEWYLARLIKYTEEEKRHD